MSKNKSAFSHRVNQQIRAKEVLVIDENDEKLGVKDIRTAIELAEEADLDLVEMAANARPPVCKIMDYSKFKYQQQKAAKKAKKNQVQVETQEIKFGPATAKHDYDFKVNHIRRFIEKGKQVKATVAFKGRENSHEELGFELLKNVAADLADIGKVENEAKRSGRSVSMLIVPK